MEPEYILDSNVIRGYLAGKLPPVGMKAISDIAENCILVTRNMADFKNISNLTVLNPWDIPTVTKW